MRKMMCLLCAMMIVFLVSCSKDLESFGLSNVNQYEEWGITLEVENVTPSGLTLVCHQNGGKNVAELMTGSFYVIYKINSSGEYAEYEALTNVTSWTMEGWIIHNEDMTTWDINWESLYGKLPEGKYCIGKEFMNFRGSGDFDKVMIYADFVVS